MTKPIRLLLLLLAPTLLLAGCTSPSKQPPQAWEISIKKITPSTIDVDLVGVSELDKPIWEAYSMDKYWKEGDTRRANADKLSMPEMQEGVPWIVKKTDPQWKKWNARGVVYLFVTAHLPGKFDGGAGDPRRRIVSLRPVWVGKKLVFEVSDSDISLLTPPK